MEILMEKMNQRHRLSPFLSLSLSHTRIRIHRVYTCQAAPRNKDTSANAEEVEGWEKEQSHRQGKCCEKK
jgi:hypothetical protein